MQHRKEKLQLALLIAPVLIGAPAGVGSRDFVLNTTQFEAARRQAIQTYGLPIDLNDVQSVGGFVRENLNPLDQAWRQIFATNGIAYTKPAVQFYFGGVDTTGCQHLDAGNSFFCYPNRTIYLDIFYLVARQESIRQIYGTPGLYAAVAVAAHEFGHAIEQSVPFPAAVIRNRDANYIALMHELNADCYAGVFLGVLASNNGMDPRGLNEALESRELAGDDRAVPGLHSPLTGRLTFFNIPDGYHGPGDERKGWLLRGYQHGPSSCRAGYNGSFGSMDDTSGTIKGSALLPAF